MKPQKSGLASPLSVSDARRSGWIPNVYHFVFGLRPQTEPFHLLHYLCLESCLRVNRPDRLVVHLHKEPHGPLWDLIRPRIDIMPIPEGELRLDLVYHDDFTRSFSYAHVSDFIRLRILHEHGGIYADMDTLFLAPPPAELFASSCVMGHERVDVHVASAPQGSLCNALIMAEAGAPFIALWMQRMPGAFDGSWSNHSTFLPYRLALEFPDIIRVESESRFFAFDWTRDGIAGLFEEDRPIPGGATSLHLWAHMWWDVERRDTSDFNHQRLTPDYVANATSTYARHARAFLPRGGVRPAPLVAPGVSGGYDGSTFLAPPAGGGACRPMNAGKGARGRALLLTHILPDRRGVGLARRGWRWASELAARHELDILLVTPHEPPVPTHPLPGTLRVLRIAELPLAPRKLADWFNPDATVAAALAALPGPPPDRIVIFRFYLHDVAALLPPEWRAIAEMDCDDWESATRWSLASLALRRRDYRLAARRVREAIGYLRLERRFLPSYVRVHVAAAEDVRRLRRLTGLTTLQASPNNILRDPGLSPAPAPAGSRTLLFVGALFYPPNADAMIWFGERVLPRLRRLIPDVRVVAAGQAGEPLQLRMARDGINYVHAPQDLRALYAEAVAVIAPVRAGGGTKLKVLEAWLHRRPLVATTHSARGIDVIPGRHLLIADRPEAFARACATLLTDRALGARLVDEAATLLRENYLV